MLHVLDAGLRSTIQDDPRRGHARLGLPGAGPADPAAFAAARALVGRPHGAVIELVGLPFSFRCDDRRLVAITGRDIAVRTATRLPGWLAFVVRPGETVTVLGTSRYAYVAVGGGIALEPVLGSCATYLPAGIGPLPRPLASGDALPLGAAGDPGGRAGIRLPAARHAGPIPVIPGPHALSAPGAFAALLSGELTVADGSDRMGVRLSGLGVKGDRRELLSCGMVPGAIQLPPGGGPIVLGPDAQTTGGYPVIAVVATAALGRVAQALPGERLRFAEVAADRAADDLRAAEAAFADDLRGAGAALADDGPRAAGAALAGS